MRFDKEPWIRKRQISNGYIDHSCVRQRRRTSCSGSKGDLHFSILCNICMMICTTLGRRVIRHAIHLGIEEVRRLSIA
jgi:hypothetical protein